MVAVGTVVVIRAVEEASINTTLIVASKILDMVEAAMLAIMAAEFPEVVVSVSNSNINRSSTSHSKASSNRVNHKSSSNNIIPTPTLAKDKAQAHTATRVGTSNDKSRCLHERSASVARIAS